MGAFDMFSSRPETNENQGSGNESAEQERNLGNDYRKIETFLEGQSLANFQEAATSIQERVAQFDSQESELQNAGCDLYPGQFRNMVVANIPTNLRVRFSQLIQPDWVQTQVDRNSQIETAFSPIAERGFAAATLGRLGGRRTEELIDLSSQVDALLSIHEAARTIDRTLESSIDETVAQIQSEGSVDQLLAEAERSPEQVGEQATVTVDNLNVRDANGEVTGEQLGEGAPVTKFPTETITIYAGNEEYTGVKIGANRYVAEDFLA